MSEMAWRYLYSTAEKGAEYQCTKCGYKITAKFGAKLPPCPNCIKQVRKCTNCKWFRHKGSHHKIGWCTRYPDWYYTENAENHYCGEFKAGEQNERTD